MTGVELTAVSMATDGRAVARESSGRVVFLSGALPGETVRARLVQERSHYADAVVEQVLEPSPDRIRPECVHVADGCGGCQWQHVGPDAQRRLKEQILVEAMSRIGRIGEVPLQPTVVLPEWRYRTTLRAAVREGRAGLRPGRSNEVVGVEGCLVVHPLLVELLHGSLYPGAQEVVLRCGARTGERLVATTPPGAVSGLPADVRADRFHELAAGRMWQVSAGSFFQSRPDGADALVALVSAAVGEAASPARALDLYSGVGLFAGVLAASGWTVTSVEGSACSTRDARHNLRDLPVRVVRSDVTRWRPERADLVVADPSRNGLGRPGVEVVAASGAGRLVLISCDAASLGRDAGLLDRAGYRLASVTPVDLFPQTFRVEAVSVFDRVRSPAPDP